MKKNIFFSLSTPFAKKSTCCLTKKEANNKK